MHSIKENSPVVRSGDVVIVQDENRKNRVLWRLGRIENVITGQDGVIRGAKVKLGNRQKIERPIKKLFPLEVRSDDVATEDNILSLNSETRTRPKRKAAEIANERINIIANS